MVNNIEMNQPRDISSITVVVPFYNEQALVQHFYETVLHELKSLNIPFSLVFVDDGSRDGTFVRLTEIANIDRRVTLVSLSRNFGHQIALTAGLDYANADVVVTMDGDLQHPPATIGSMITAYREGADVVYGVRQGEANRGLFKRLTARLYYKLLERMTQVEVIAGSSDFRLMSRSALDILKKMPERHRYLRGMVPWMGFPHTIVRYHEGNRHSGSTKYTFRKMLRLARHGFFSFSTASLDMITTIGSIMTFFSMIYLVYVLLAPALVGHVVPGWTSVIVVLLLVSGVQLISIGIIAQYIGMIFEEIKRRPLYIVKYEHLADATHDPS